MSRDLEQSTEPIRQPRYLQLLALLAFHTFIREGVDAAIFETHHGGEYDATNVIRKPVVTGITSLGMDHIAQLGPMIEDIAWHKAGIFKPEVPAFSVQQEPGASEVLRDRATEKKTDLSFVMSCDDLPTNSRVLSVPVQRINCSLAFQLATTFLRLKSSYDINAEDIQKGIDNFSWNGRFEIIEKEDAQWFLDGAHNILSLKQVAEWFSRNVDTANTENGRSGYRVLIFSHFSEERDGVALVRYLARAFSDCNLRFDHVIFTTYQEREDGTTRIDKTLKSPETPFPDLCTQYSILWKDLHPYATISIEPTIEGAIKAAKQLSVDQGGMQTLVTGSLHMVGGALKLLRP
ncbi:hypothetical protein PENVUL_c012G03401 [Penicillium vulpinum]|uniref:tetrahydrofolate synthase n=2 Tax=Penicillium vulpinum TaxID=29845 RepID=A0A1V6S1D7_9EURO|nr:hypothetical protein PENVUL_c012G03401 [Penicillium vulpinum]